MKINAGFELTANLDTLEFTYGEDVFGPVTGKRYLNDIRKSLSDPKAEGMMLRISICRNMMRMIREIVMRCMPKR